MIFNARVKGGKLRAPLRSLNSDSGKIKQSPQKSLESPGEKIPNQ